MNENRGQFPANGRANQNDDREPFRLDISFDQDQNAMDLNSVLEDTPSHRGEVYFSNRPSYAPPSARPKKKAKKRRTGSVITLLLVSALAVSAMLSYVGITFLQDVFALRGDNSHREAEFTLEPNQSTNEVIDILASNGLLRQRTLDKLYMGFSFYIRSQNVDDPKQPDYLPGKYTVSTKLGLEEMLNHFKLKPPSSETVHLMFQEGYTVKQIVEKLSTNRVASVDSLKRVMLNSQYEYPFLKDTAVPGRYYQYEGYLFPDTYEFFVNDNVNSVFQRFFENFEKKWTENGFDKKAAERGMSMDQVVILASIVQKEAANNDEMTLISRILHNRLDRPGVYPLLECDSTRDYVNNNIATEMDAHSADYYGEIYSTYRTAGLPVGPICNPGIAAINAALNPSTKAEHKDLYYFQHDKNGKIYTAETKAEHNANTTAIVIAGLRQ